MRAFAWFMARCGMKTDQYLRRYKVKLFSELSGTVLEIGSGAGANLHYLPTTGIKWIGVDPNPFMQPHLVKEAHRLDFKIELRDGTAEKLPAADESVDFVISTLVLCSVMDQKRALEEVARVLKPGGKLLFIEHVAARRGSWLYRIQHLVKPLWRRMGDGCHPDRETRMALESAGFASIEIEEFVAPLPVVSPHIVGTAVKSGASRIRDIIG
jgi:ubiquinone/menaquinone biosynthesis C-methylase UbiE